MTFIIRVDNGFKHMIYTESIHYRSIIVDPGWLATDIGRKKKRSCRTSTKAIYALASTA